MKTLIERFEKATEGNAAIDEAICQAVGASRSIGSGEWPYTEALPYTDSFDAAMTLVSEGKHWLVRYHGGEEVIHPINGPEHNSKGSFGFANIDAEFPVFAATPIIAFCIAALKARMKEQDE